MIVRASKSMSSWITKHKREAIKINANIEFHTGKREQGRKKLYDIIAPNNGLGTPPLTFCMQDACYLHA